MPRLSTPRSSSGIARVSDAIEEVLLVIGSILFHSL
jgi:hypothetical protein